MNSFYNNEEPKNQGSVFAEAQVQVFPKDPAGFTPNYFPSHYNSNYNWNQVTPFQSLNTSTKFGSGQKIPQFQGFSTPTQMNGYSLQGDYYSSSSEKDQRPLMGGLQPKPFNCNFNVNNSQPPIIQQRYGTAFEQKPRGRGPNPGLSKALKQQPNRKPLTKYPEAQKVKRSLFASNSDGNQQQNQTPISSKAIKPQIKLSTNSILIKQKLQNIGNIKSFIPQSSSQPQSIQDNNITNSFSFQNQNSENIAINNNNKNNINKNIKNLLKFQKQQAASDPMYKTQLCKNWQEFGTCRYSEKCRFAHGPHELLNKQNKNQNYKTKDCKKFSNGYCPYGFRCLFKHETRKEQELRMGKFQTALRFLGLRLFEMKRLSVFKEICERRQQQDDEGNESSRQQIQIIQTQSSHNNNIAPHLQQITNYNRLIQVAA